MSFVIHEMSQARHVPSPRLPLFCKSVLYRKSETETPQLVLECGHFDILITVRLSGILNLNNFSHSPPLLLALGISELTWYFLRPLVKCHSYYLSIWLQVVEWSSMTSYPGARLLDLLIRHRCGWWSHRWRKTFETPWRPVRRIITPVEEQHAWFKWYSWKAWSS